jgi:hypothetical protein
LRPELPTLDAELGVLRREIVDKIGRDIAEQYHDLEQREQLGVDALCKFRAFQSVWP